MVAKSYWLDGVGQVAYLSSSPLPTASLASIRMMICTQGPRTKKRKIAEEYNFTEEDLKSMNRSIYEGDLKALQDLIAKGADVKAEDSRGNTALHLASSVEVAKCLVENGADINQVNEIGMTPLMCLVSRPRMNVRSRIKIIKYLLDKGAKTQYDGYTILHTAQEYEVFEFLFDHCPELRPLMFAPSDSSSSLESSPAITYPCPLYWHTTDSIKVVLQVLQKYGCPKEVERNCRILMSVSNERLKGLKCVKYRFTNHHWQLYLADDEQISGCLNMNSFTIQDQAIDQYLSIYKGCFGRPQVDVVLSLFESYLDRGLVDEAVTIMNEAMQLELSYCQSLLSKPRSFLHLNIVSCCCHYVHTICILDKHKNTLQHFDILLLVKVNICFLKLQSHHNCVPTSYELRYGYPMDETQIFSNVLKVFGYSLSVPSLRSSVVALAENLVSQFLRFPYGNNVLNVGMDFFMYGYYGFFDRITSHGPATLEMLLEIDGTRSVINDVVGGQTLLSRVLSQIRHYWKQTFSNTEVDEDARSNHLAVLKLLIDAGAHLDATNKKGLTIFSYRHLLHGFKLDSGVLLHGFKLDSGVRPLYCLSANAIALYQLPYEDLMLPSHVIKFIRLHDKYYFRSFDVVDVEVYFFDSVFKSL